MKVLSWNKKRWLLAGAPLFLLLSGAAFRQWVLPYCLPLPEKQLAVRIPARRYFDVHGEPLHMEPGFDYSRRFPVRLAEVPEALRSAALAVEDRNFYRHDGVDLRASLRAFAQLLRHRRIVSGASTVTMQLMAMAEPGERSFGNKLWQMETARAWEKKYSKEEVLEDYFNFLPYGGKIYGVEAAARYYFGRRVSELNYGECALLAGIPQRPNRFRPDRHPEAARRRQKAVLDILVRRKILTEVEALRIYEDEPLRYRDFSLPAWPRAEDPQFFQLVKSPGDVRTTLDSYLRAPALALLKQAAESTGGVRDGGMVIIENRTGKVRMLIGTLDFNSPRAGQVNAAVARRSPGSALKPLLFGEAVEGGILVADTILEDAPLLYAGYRPGNFDGSYRGRVTAADALADSLNTPAIRVMELLGEERVLRLMEQLELCDSASPDRPAGLSLALGGVEVDLLHLTTAYAAIASGGCYRSFRLLEDAEEPETFRFWSPGSAGMLLSMLRSRPLPNASGLAAAWKTGTSNGNRDAWCIAMTPEWAVGVWFGNKDGSRSPDLVGGTLAAPVAGAMLQTLYRGKPSPQWPEFAARPVELCRMSGLRAGDSCGESFQGAVADGIPLRSCRRCAEPPSATPTMVTVPAPGTYHAGQDGNALFHLASTSRQLHCYLNNRYQGTMTNGSELSLSPGYHTLLFREEGRPAAEIRLRVLPHSLSEVRK